MAKKQIKWTRRALESKMSIMEYWFQETGSPDYSMKLDSLFNSTIELITSLSKIGTLFDEKRNIRYVVVRNYKIYYTSDEHYIVILAIWDTRRDHNNFTI